MTFEELVAKVFDLKDKEKNTNSLASENRTLIEELQEENKQLKTELEELESVM